METLVGDICIIGAGSGGLSVAAAASQMGAKVILCEGDKMGGDCLNYGCVPSKALIEASRTFKSIHHGKHFGIKTKHIEVDFSDIHQHILNVIQTIEKHDSVERFEGLGVKVIQHPAHFIDNHTIQAGHYQIHAKHTVIATGSHAMIPDIPGLTELDYLTNENIFSLDKKPNRLAIIGGGPIGCEIANAYALLGTEVLLLEATPQILAPADKEARAVIKSALINAGVTIFEDIKITHISNIENDYQIQTNKDTFQASHLLIATGRTPNIQSLKLENTSIKYNKKGIEVDKRMRTSQKRIFAIGDIASPYQFTHAAGYQASIVIQNILFKLPSKVSYDAFPWVIYTTPELAHTGMSLTMAATKNASLLKYPYCDNDRAIAGKHTEGFIKVAVGKKGVILGVTIVGEHAGELISPWSIAIKAKLNIKQMASFIAPYPSLTDISKRVAGSYFTPLLFSKKTKRIVKFLMKYF